MNRKHKFWVVLLATIGIVSLSGCSSESTNNDWRLWNFSIVFLIILLLILIVLLVCTVIRNRKRTDNLKEMVVDNKLSDAINKATEDTLNKSKLSMDPLYLDLKVPLAENNEYIIADINRYITNKINVIKNTKEGMRPTSYKVKGKKAFALLADVKDGNFKLTLKCGPAYGAKLCEIFPDTVTQAKFPYGLIWFTVINEKKQPSLELIKQMIDISYEIAKIGF